jgi:hypothetical protein
MLIPFIYGRPEASALNLYPEGKFWEVMVDVIFECGGGGGGQAVAIGVFARILYDV